MKCIGSILCLMIATIAAPVAAHDEVYEYRVEVYNALGETITVSCPGTHDHRLHAGDATVVESQGGEYLQLECTAYDHHGRELAHRHFDLDHHHRRTRWTVEVTADHHDDGDDDQGDGAKRDRRH